jgi:hypothetical protein
MRYNKTIDSGYIISIGTGSGGTEITEQEYAEILATIRKKPNASGGYDYRLKTGLTWEEYKLPPVEPEPPTDEEALTRYANELTGADDPDLISAAETLITDRIKEEH